MYLARRTTLYLVIIFIFFFSMKTGIFHEMLHVEEDHLFLLRKIKILNSMSVTWVFVNCFFLYWSVIDLECCINHCCMAKWFNFTYVHIFIIFSSIMVYLRILNIAPSAICSALLFIHSMCNTLPLITPNSQPTPSQYPLSLDNQKSVSMILFLFYR